MKLLSPASIRPGSIRARLILGAVALFAAGGVHAGYRIENVTYPAELRGGISAVAFTPAGSLVVATRYGELWVRSAGPSPAWRRFARGLDEPMGVIAEAEDTMYVAHRPELLRVRDTDRDGEADTFDALGGKWGLAHNYHEFFFGLARDREGNFYGSPSLDSTVTANAAHKAEYPTLPFRGERNREHVLEPSGHWSEGPWRGWVMRITPSGELEPFAAGFRQTNGMAISPQGELFVTDNQGDYKAGTGLLHVAEGDFHGHADSLKWEPGFDAANATLETLWQRLKTPAVVFPHGPMGVSPGQPAWDTTGGKFGPFAGQVFTGDYSRLVIRATLEEVNGTWQGACFPFLGRNETPPFATGERLKSGATRTVFAPDGSLYLGATAGWGAGEDGLQRVTWDGTVPAEMHSISLTSSGFRITFTRSMNRETIATPENYSLNRFRYYYHRKYGSPWVDEAEVTLQSVRVAADARSVELIVNDLEPGFIYEFSVPTLRTSAGKMLANPLAYYTANRLRNGVTTIGGTTRLAHPDEASLGAKEAPGETAGAPTAAVIAAGEKVYRFYCVACHQPDGRGVAGGAANFIDDRTRLAKSDADLLKVITDGNEAKAMPAFGSMLTPHQRRAVLAYIRDAFGAKPSN